MEIERISAEPGFRLGALGALAISVWDSVPRLEHVKASVELLHRLGQEHDGIELLAVIGDGCHLPDASVRQVLAKGLVAVAPRILAVANVIEGGGFLAAAQRGVLTGLGIVVRNQYPQEVFASIPKASRFLARESRSALTASDINRAVGELRAGVVLR